jgi:hypothetical protein
VGCALVRTHGLDHDFSGIYFQTDVTVRGVGEGKGRIIGKDSEVEEVVRDRTGPERDVA